MDELITISVEDRILTVPADALRSQHRFRRHVLERHNRLPFKLTRAEWNRFKLRALGDYLQQQVQSA